MGFDYELGGAGGGDGVSEMGCGVDEGGRGEGATEGEGSIGEAARCKEFLGGNQELAWGREGDLNGSDDVSAWQ